ncbi:WecB/TagA/CpsF family glycosyltransferase [Qipengyuania flava]|uniref:WecB/TagA/CpsF family glycosyltransferase n=1 Tax=Qipengyuania flava TaxID=192812 RepID=UPI001C62A65F|nr:WecB/TagA/CpsF family glycosyltransferase [Qipengyuania flava]QYJ06359.1 WecB/TagA/CpsF family glycosyltransferase [Qipengyuania flava]
MTDRVHARTTSAQDPDTQAPASLEGLADGVLESLSTFADEAECLAAIDQRIAKEGCDTLAFINAHAFNMMCERPSFAKDLLAASLLVRDGKGMEIFLDRLGHEPGANLNGTDLIPAVLARHTDKKVAVFGTRDPWLSKGCAELEARGNTIVSKVDGFQDESAYLGAVDETKPEIVVLAMGMPRQEAVASAIAERCSWQPRLVICGGAIIDFLSNRHSRAPKWLRASGFEWVYRLALEPRRLFRRYVIGNVQFLNRLKTIERNRK